jgi:hypothetical protein
MNNPDYRIRGVLRGYVFPVSWTRGDDDRWDTCSWTFPREYCRFVLSEHEIERTDRHALQTGDHSSDDGLWPL